MGEPASWLRIFSRPPICKPQELMKTFCGHRQALAAVAHAYSSGNLEELFDGVRKRPHGVIIFKNIYIEEANNSVLFILKRILRSVMHRMRVKMQLISPNLSISCFCTDSHHFALTFEVACTFLNPIPSRHIWEQCQVPPHVDV
ncbi:unnamed protein product [Cuscuta campestris]|uniref:Uncharacterized protein n=1 Tax=Cuscuta campestris TaxID=132261 RepID=A0A484LCS9_9ASTE|nr:unnamed protein product [Cuscuta campestris]